jgi:DNA gyrase subunit A
MDLARGDRVISMSILDHVEVSIEERDAFLRYDAALRRQNGNDNGEADEQPVDLEPERIEELSRRQQLILTVTANGFGKRTSAYEYRVTNRGGQGIINIETSKRNGPVVAAFPVALDDQVMLVTDKGKVIRIPVDGIRIASRNTQGVTLFSTEPGEHVVSVARLLGTAEANGNDEAGEAVPDGGGGNGAEPLH